jgi:peptide/nickel transport system ATP-binding protein
MGKLLEINNLKTYFYQDGLAIRAVDGIDLEIQPKETVGLVGESGCGKTISALSITRILPQEAKILSGEINFLNQNLLKLRTDELQKIRGAKISYVFQEPATSLNPVFTVGEQIAESLMLHLNLSKKQAKAKAEELLVQVGISAPKERLLAYPHQLSGGMKQRAMIAMAIATQPKLLIADEPTTALDVTIQAQILDLLLKLREEIGLSILLITHDLSIISKFADRVYVMYAGRIVESAPAELLYKRPLHPYTQGLLRCIPQPQSQKGTLATISGVVPPAWNLPSGCKFHPRCALKDEQCQSSEPQMEELEPAHFVKCWKAKIQ